MPHRSYRADAIRTQIMKTSPDGGGAIFSGLLAGEADEAEAALAAVGFVDARRRAEVDANGDEWISLLMTRA